MEQNLARELGKAALTLRDFLEAIEERIDLHRLPRPDGRQADSHTLSVLEEVAERAEYLISALEMAERHTVSYVYRH